MICDHCGYTKSQVIDTRASPKKIVRKRKCPNCGEIFVTIEAHRHKVTMRFGLPAEARRIRDISIAERLHMGWELLAQEYGLTKTAVYYAAARGRNYLGQGARNAVSYRKDKK